LAPGAVKGAGFEVDWEDVESLVHADFSREVPEHVALEPVAHVDTGVFAGTGKLAVSPNGIL